MRAIVHYTHGLAETANIPGSTKISRKVRDGAVSTAWCLLLSPENHHFQKMCPSPRGEKALSRQTGKTGQRFPKERLHF